VAALGMVLIFITMVVVGLAYKLLGRDFMRT
jgi:hypothetical protein